MKESRIFWVDEDGAAVSTEGKTVLVRPEELQNLQSQDSFRQLFTKHYGRFREWWSSCPGEGISLLVVDRDAACGGAFLATRPTTIASAIIGRHENADLRLSDPALSLRHMAVLLYPRGASGKTRFRLVDLRTASAFYDERGRRLQALEADGPAFVRCGRYWFAFFPMEEEPLEMPPDAEAAWEAVPDRLYLDEVKGDEKPRSWEADSDRAWEVDALPRLMEPPTLVHSLAGPKTAVHELLEEGDRKLGELEISSPRGVAKIALGESVARTGVLLGRSRRCDAGRVLSDRSISRVHLLIIEVAGRLYAVDTASYNGTWGALEGSAAGDAAASGRAQERAMPLEPGLRLSLGDFATLSWTPA